MMFLHKRALNSMDQGYREFGTGQETIQPARKSEASCRSALRVNSRNDASHSEEIGELQSNRAVARVV
jgi:hypothetical protein